MLIALICIRLLQDTSWWLNNSGQSLGIAGEDINYTAFDFETFNGTGVRLISMADGANPYHIIYENRSLVTNFIDGFTDLLQPLPSRGADLVGQRSLGLAAGAPGVCRSDGVAPGVDVLSLRFFEGAHRNESLQYILCRNASSWDISLLSYKIWACQDRECQYIPASVVDQSVADSCLYDLGETAPLKVKKFVVPTGQDGYLTDVFFTPPTRWPLMFAITSLSNRGLPINRGVEGTGVFMSSPGTRMDQDTPPAQIPWSIAGDNASCSLSSPHLSFNYANASAAIFAGGLAVLHQVNPNLSLPDIWYILASTATVANPFSLLWNKNAYGLYFNRRLGFGRLNLGKAVHLAQSWNWNISTFHAVTVSQIDVLIPLTECDNQDPRSNLTFQFDKAGHVMVVTVVISAQNLGFGSLIVHVISPAGTVSELKFLTEWSHFNADVQRLDLVSNEFLGEPLKGSWILRFPQVDSAARGLIVSANVTAYYTDTCPPQLDLQTNGSDPFAPLDESLFHFKEPSVTMYSGSNFSTDITWDTDNTTIKMCWYNAWLQVHGQRVKLKTHMTAHNTTLVLDYVPSVFRTGTEMNLTMESLVCGFSRSVPIKYVHNSSVDHPLYFRKKGRDYQWYDNETILVPLGDWLNGSTTFELIWHQNLSQLIDDGYSNSACISLLTAETKQVVRRVFERNLGQVDYTVILNGEIPSNRRYRLEISPTSARREGFPPLYVYLEMIPVDGAKVAYETPFTTARMVGIVILFSLSLLCVVWRIYALAKRKEADQEEAVPFKSHDAPRGTWSKAEQKSEEIPLFQES
jgi:cbb3-type cytochrome oxidase subunit 3